MTECDLTEDAFFLRSEGHRIGILRCDQQTRRNRQRLIIGIVLGLDRDVNSGRDVLEDPTRGGHARFIAHVNTLEGKCPNSGKRQHCDANNRRGYGSQRGTLQCRGS